MGEKSNLSGPEAPQESQSESSVITPLVSQEAQSTEPQRADPPTSEQPMPEGGQFAPRPFVQARPFVSQEEKVRKRREALGALQLGEWREGKVTGIAQFGAFVDLGGVDGLVHVSQLGAGGYVERVEDVVQVGQIIRVRVAEVDMDRQRVSLSMREPRPAGAPPARERPAAPSAPRTPRPAAPTGFPTTWTEPPPEQRPDRRSRGGGDRPNFGRDERSSRRSERPRRNRDEDEEWRTVRGDPRGYYSFGEETEDEPAPTTAEELVARFGRRGSNR